MVINLCDMKVGDTGRVVGFEKSFTAYRQQLLAMGLTPGTEFQVIRVEPLGGQWVEPVIFHESSSTKNYLYQLFKLTRWEMYNSLK